jgi:DNA-binding NtrC family response regulator/pSer/pThr/pTyr-binding forkhead associated (FHA) protein
MRPGDTTATLPEPGAERLYLLVIDAASSRIVDLSPECRVVVGRGTGADVRLEDAAVSRIHATLTVGDGAVDITDHGSHNGTSVNGERIQGTRALGSGDAIEIGSATLVLHGASRPRRAPRMVELVALRARLDEEIQRSAEHECPLSLLAVLLGPGGRDRDAVMRATTSSLRAIDVAGWASPDQLYVLVPELSRDEVSATAGRLVAALGALALEARAGLAVYPDDGVEADTLLAAARAAAVDAAAPGTVASASSAGQRIQIGEHTAVVADPAMRRIYELVRRLAASSLPVLIMGETGAGKELAALALHSFSARARRRFLHLNCAALQETLLEGELFGYERGAFSGATVTKPGLLETASEGTVFLDEVGELPLAIQAKLLLALESRRFIRLGGVSELKLDIRIVAATNRDLEEQVKVGRFRQDLLYRLNAATVLIPPLRERPREVGLLARSLLAEGCVEARRSPMILAPATARALAGYAWPGNVRELRNVMHYLAATVLADVVEPWHLPDKMVSSATPLLVEATPAPAPARAPRAGFRPLSDELRDLERTRMAEALEASGGVKTRAAELIGMPLRTFAAKMKQYGIAARTRER